MRKEIWFIVVIFFVAAVLWKGNQKFEAVNKRLNALTDQVAAQQHNVDTVVVVKYFEMKWDSTKAVDGRDTYLPCRHIDDYTPDSATVYDGVLGKQGGK